MLRTQLVTMARAAFDLALREAQQRERRARLPADLLGTRERRFRFVELTEATPDVTHLRVRRGAVAHMAVRELFARERGFALGFGEVAAALQHDRAVHAADAGEDRERMPVGPAHRRLGPLGGAVVVAHVFAGADEAAVHLARRVRTEPALDREQHRLVEVAHALGDLALVDEHAPLRLQRLGLQVGRPQVAGERDHVGRERRRALELTASVRDFRFAQEQRTVGRRTRCRLRGCGARAAATRSRWRDAR